MKNKLILGMFLLLNSQNHFSLAAPLDLAFTYQGRLTSEGIPATGWYDFQVSLWTDLDGDAQVGSTLTLAATPVTNGLFVLGLDFGSDAFRGDARWLELSVRTNGAASYDSLLPRQPLTPVPNALYTPNAGSALLATTAISASGVANNAVTATGIAGGQVVKSLNGLRDDVQLAAGANMTLSTNGNTLQLSGVGAGLSGGWSLAGNAGTTATDFLGTIDEQPLEIRVGNQTALRLEPAGANLVNLIGGSSYNTVGTEVIGATIGGGGSFLRSLPPFPSVDERNAVWADFGGIGGGRGNMIETNGTHGTIPGGFHNSVNGESAFAAGHRAKAEHGGTFVWADATDADFASTAPNQFLVRALGGMGINTTNPARALEVRDFTGINMAGGNIQVGSYNAGDDPKLIHFGDRQGSGLGYVYLGENGQDDRLEFRASTFFFNAGSVGVGIPNPATALDVVGTVRATSFQGDGTGLTFPNPAVFSSNVGIGGAPMDAKLDVEGNIRLNNNDLFLRDGTDRNHGLGWYGAGKLFGGVNVDGPVLYGWSGGGVGTVNPSQQLALSWNNLGTVSVDPGGRNTNGLSSGLNFGGNSGEGIASKRNPGGNQFGLDFYTSYQPRLSIANNGNVGVGTQSPQSLLHVNGLASVKSLQILGGSDIAEPFDVATIREVKPGHILCIDSARPGQLRLSSQAYDPTVAGIVSGAGGVHPGLTLTQEGSPASGALPVALTGRAYCWVDAEAGGPVHAGDLLTTSETPGHAMKVTDRARAAGAILGKAMSRLESGRGLVLVLVTLQ